MAKQYIVRDKWWLLSGLLTSVFILLNAVKSLTRNEGQTKVRRQKKERQEKESDHKLETRRRRTERQNGVGGGG